MKRFALSILLALAAFAVSAASPVNVQTFGAKCDGISNDSAAISNARASLTTGGTLVFPAGTCVANSSIISTVDGLTIQGQGINATTIKFTGSSGSGIVLDGVNWNTIRDLTVNMNSSAGSANGIKVAGSWYTNIQRVRVISALQSCLRVQDARNDDTTQRGSYFTNIEHSFFGDYTVGCQDGLTLNSTGIGGVTFTTMRNAFSSWNTRYGMNFQGAGAPAQVISVSIIGGGSNNNTAEAIRMTNGTNTNRVFDVSIVGMDIESNGVNPTITNDATSKGLFVFGIQGGTYQTNMKQIVELGRSNGGPPQWWQGTGESPWTFFTNALPGVKLTGKDATQGVELQLDNTIAISGRIWGISSATNGLLQFVDRTGGAAKLSLGATVVQPGVGFAVTRVTPVYGASIPIDASLGNSFVVTVTDGAAHAFAAPSSSNTGQRIKITVRNTFGAIATATFNPAYKTAGYAAPANGFSTSADFEYDGANWVQVSGWVTAIPN